VDTPKDEAKTSFGFVIIGRLGFYVSSALFFCLSIITTEDAGLNATATSHEIYILCLCDDYFAE